MKNFISILLLLLCIGFPICSSAEISEKDKSRVIVTTDLGGTDPDDIQSIIHLLLCADMVDIEGFVSSHTWVDLQDNSSLIKKYIDEYAKVYDRLCVHSSGFPQPDFLKSVTVYGQHRSNMDGVGDGMESDGSNLIIDAVDDRSDDRPVWVLSWGGSNTVAQALWTVRKTRSADDLEKFVSKLRVYDVLGQDDAGAWIAKNFPQLLYIRNAQVYGWAPSDEWVDRHIQCKGSLGKAYPERIWATEGDSPAFLYLLANGLNYPEYPDYGGWGGRFDIKKQEGIRGMSFIVSSGKDETQYDPYFMTGSAPEGIGAVNRWRDEILNNLAARMMWTLTDDYSEVNHHPIAVLGKDRSLKCLYRKSKPGARLEFDASRSADPDGDALNFNWSIYKEPGTYGKDVDIVPSDGGKCVLKVPEDASGCSIHLVLKVSDNGTPSLTSYRRIVINVK